MPNLLSVDSSYAVGDIVAFRFPSTESNASREKERPCLILDIDGECIVVAYGTSSTGRTNRGYDVFVNREGDWRASGLRKPTRFVGKRRVRVPVNSPRLVQNACGSSRIGQLPESLLPRLEQVRSLTLSQNALPKSRAPQLTIVKGAQ